MRLLAEAQLECARAGGARAVAQAHAEPLARNAERLARVLTSSLTRRTSAGMAAAV
jgi:hypothetical protein